MPITIHSEKKLFHLFGKTFSYVLYVDEKRATCSTCTGAGSCLTAT